MKLTEEKLNRVAHIPTAEVEQDLAEAKLELDKYEYEKHAIETVGIDPTNRVRHYMLSAKCYKGIEFIDELKQILEHRKKVA